jgi:hypothetical protein
MTQTIQGVLRECEARLPGSSKNSVSNGTNRT